MQNLIIYIAAVGFLIAVFPVYFAVYTYANTNTNYASINFCLYRYIRFLNINTTDSWSKMQINGRDTNFNLSETTKIAKILLDNVCIFKIVQLGDYGIKSDANAYIVLMQNACTLPLYKYLEGTGSKCKLRNYVILNADHEELHYCSKAVCVINLLAALKIILIIFSERLK